MPLYELFCLSSVSRAVNPSGLKDILKNAGRIVLGRGGIVTDVKSFGEQELAYEICRPGVRHSSAEVWQMTFMSSPDVVKDVERGLRLDEGVIRWSVLKRKDGESRMPSSYRVARMAEEVR